MKKETIIELLCDTFCVEYLFEIRRNIADIETRNIFNNFLLKFLPVIIEEIRNLLNNEQLLDKNSFYTSQYKGIVTNKRHEILKATIYSKKIKRLVSDMGINFIDNIWDINIVVNINELISFNFANYEETNEYDDNFWSSLAILNRDICNATLTTLSSNINCNVVLQELISKIMVIKARILNDITPQRFTYSTSMLFSISPNLEYYDKLLILYRYEIVKELMIFTKYIQDFSLEITTSNYGIIQIDFKNFIIKMKAVAIYIIGNDLKPLDTNFSRNIKSKLCESNIDDLFYKTNGLLRNNLHYSLVNCVTPEEMKLIEKNQDTYLSILLNFFNSAINVVINEKVRKITDFGNKCLHKGYTGKFVSDNFEKLYSDFLIFGKKGDTQ